MSDYDYGYQVKKLDFVQPLTGAQVDWIQVVDRLSF